LKEFSRLSAIRQKLESGLLKITDLVSFYLKNIDANKHLDAFLEIYIVKVISGSNRIQKKIDNIVYKGQRSYASSKIFILLFVLVFQMGFTQTDSLITDSSSFLVEVDFNKETFDSSLTGFDLIERYDSLSQLNFLFENNDVELAVITPLPLVEIPDSILIERIQKINEQTPMDLNYSPYVKSYIKVYAGKKKELTEKTMGLADLYFPIFEEMLDRYEIPEELKYLAIVESALNPKARSRMGATGQWQFMYLTGKSYGLTINSYIDERRDPYLATEAACRYLKFLHNIYDDWSLALAAYNSGPGNVNKAIRRSGGKRTFNEIRRYLPRETRSYVPAFIAINYLYNYPDDYQFVKKTVKIDFEATDTVHVNQRVIFEFLAAFTGVDKETISFLNPMYRRQVIPATKDHSYAIVLPKEAIPIFIINADSIYSKSKSTDPKYEVPEYNQEMIVHRVRSGEVLGTIAELYHVRVRDLQEWNNLRSSRINIGQKLVIYTNKKPSSSSKPKKKPLKETVSDGNYVYHVVREGDTLWDIANEYSGVTVDQIIELNQEVNTRRLKPGQKIKISVK
jgi:membrane-bound lytic murein transglycosylase D